MDHNSSSPLPWSYGVGIPQRFSAKYQRYLQLGGLVDVTADAGAYAGDQPLQDVERLMFLSLAFDQIHKEGLEGDFLELGVYQGSTAAVLARHARRLDKRLYLLDTYEGFASQDFEGMDSGRRVAFTETSLEAVRARVGDEKTIFVKGYFPETAARLPDDARYCLVHIDTDLYAPIMSGLEHFYPRMVPGGYLIVHDYGSLAWEGSEKAVDIFFADKPECVIQIPDSCGSAVIRKMRPAGGEANWITRRQRLAEGVWHAAGNGRLARILTDGWSAPEDWGTWGVGASHQIKLMIDPSGGEVSVDIDAHGYVGGGLAERVFDVLVNGMQRSVVRFSQEQKFVSMSLGPLQAVDRLGSLTIEFRPRTVLVPREVDPPSEETRELGVALHRLRVRRETAA